jgi:hypothetical protein
VRADKRYAAGSAFRLAAHRALCDSAILRRVAALNDFFGRRFPEAWLPEASGAPAGDIHFGGRPRRLPCPAAIL